MPKLASELSGQVNERLNQVGPSGIREFDRRVSAVPDIIKLTLGEPDLNTPEHVKQAGIKSIQENDTTILHRRVLLNCDEQSAVT